MYDFNKICCICFNPLKRNHFLIANKDDNNVSYVDKLEKCVHTKIEITEQMKICKNCVKQLDATHEFIKTLLQAMELWSKQEQKDENKVAHIIYINDEKQILDNNEKKSSIEELILKIDGNDYGDIFSQKSNTSWMNEASFYCSVCIQNFQSEQELIDHDCPKVGEIVKCDNSKEIVLKGLFPCKLCNLTFNKRYELIKHRRLHTEQRQKVDTDEEKKFVCTFCNKTFKQLYHLREHITSHTGEKNYSCNICMKKFQRMSSKRRHMKTHEAPPGQKTKQTPFLCTICGKKFPYSNGAQRHMRIHFGERRYECNFCGKKFSQSTHLNVHKRVHTGEKPYICDMCGELFALNATLQKHRENHKKEKKNIKSEYEIGYKIETYLDSSTIT